MKPSNIQEAIKVKKAHNYFSLLVTIVFLLITTSGTSKNISILKSVSPSIWNTNTTLEFKTHRNPDTTKVLITGLVTDESGYPLPDVNIYSNDTKNGVQSNYDGIFELEASLGETLTISYVGMKTQNIQISDTTTVIDVILEEEDLSLEMIVSCTTQRITTSYLYIKPTEIAKKNMIAFQKIKKARKKAARKQRREQRKNNK